MTTLADEIERLAVLMEPAPWEIDGEGRIFHRRDPLTKYVIAGIQSSNTDNEHLILTLANNIPTIVSALRGAEQVREKAAQVADKGRDYWHDKCNATKNRRESRDYETMAIACVHVAYAIREMPLEDRT